MKKYCVIITAFFLIACGGGKEVIEEKSVPEDILLVGAGSTSEESSGDSVAEAFLSNESPRMDESGTRIKTVRPKFIFSIEPADTFDIALGKELAFHVKGGGISKISLFWNNSMGERKEYKQNVTIGETFTRVYPAQLVKRLFGTGFKQIEAQIMYNDSRDSVTLDTVITIIDSAPNKIVEIQPDTIKLVKPVIEKTDTIDSIAPSKDFAVNTDDLQEAMKPDNVTQLVNELSIDDIFFESNKWKIPSLSFNSNYIIGLSKIVKALKLDENVKVQLIGQTDTAGDSEYNKSLAEKRCLTVGKLILNLIQESEKEGIAHRIEIISSGENSPLIDNPNRMTKALNRRVSIKLSYTQQNNKTMAEYLSEMKLTEKAKPQKTATAKTTRQVRNLSPQHKIYNKAKQNLNSKQYDDAIILYEEIVNMNPQHSLADNAKWWIGEAYYYQKRYQEALSAYQAVFGLGDKNKAAYAQLRIGYCYLRLGQKSTAIQEFKKVASNYPKEKEVIQKARNALYHIQQ